MVWSSLLDARMMTCHVQDICMNIYIYIYIYIYSYIYPEQVCPQPRFGFFLEWPNVHRVSSQKIGKC